MLHFVDHEISLRRTESRGQPLMYDGVVLIRLPQTRGEVGITAYRSGEKQSSSTYLKSIA